MSGRTVKALTFRWWYMTWGGMQKWILVFRLAFPLGLCLLKEAIYTTMTWTIEPTEYSFNLTSILHYEYGPRDVVVCACGVKPTLAHDLMTAVRSLVNITQLTYANYPIQFEEALKEKNSSSLGLLFHTIASDRLEYTIRPVGKWAYEFETAHRFPPLAARGPGQWHPYLVSGFMALQVAVDEAYIRRYALNISSWELKSRPYPRYERVILLVQKTANSGMPFREDLIQKLLTIMTLMPLTLGHLVIAIFFVYAVQAERKNGMREMLHLNGATRWMVNFSWLISFSIELTILAVIETLIISDSLKFMNSTILFIAVVLNNSVLLCWMNTLARNNVLFVIVYILASAGPFTLDLSVEQAFIAMLPNHGLPRIFKAYLEFDGAEKELGFGDLFTSPVHCSPVGVYMLVMLAAVILHVLLSVYLDLVNPGPFGRAKPWYLCYKEDHTEPRGQVQPQSEDGEYFEPIDPKTPISLECVGVYKYFRKIKALDNVNLRIVGNKATVLLGHNGAGKTTLFSILSGVYSPTRGKLYADEYDVFEGNNIREFRRNLGYCPQASILEDQLSTEQHLVIFSILKGLTKTEALQYSDYWTQMFRMFEDRKKLVRKLSGGTRRKLSLAIALTGDPKYLLLDEPSSGLDPESTLSLRGILLEAKATATILMTTHDMDEADAIGDRVAFLSDGKLKGYGTPPFLKKKLGISYKLKCDLIKKGEAKKLTNFIKKLDPSMTVLYQTHQGVTFGLSPKISDIQRFMKSLESEFGNKIVTSLSNTTMDDVFLKIQPDLEKIEFEELQVHESDFDRSIFTCSRITELMTKRLLWIRSEWENLVIMIGAIFVAPAVFSFLASNTFNLQWVFPPPLSLDLTMGIYRGSEAVISPGGTELNDALRSNMEKTGIEIVEVGSGQEMRSYLLDLAKRDLFRYRSSFVFAFDTVTTPTAYYSENAYHAAPIAYSALINAMLNGNSSIVTHVFPLANSKDFACEYDIVPRSLFVSSLAYMMMLFGMYWTAFPHIENRAQFKRLQLMTGLLPSTYWIANFIFDMALYLVSLTFMIVVFALFDQGLYMNASVMPAMIVVMLLYGVSCITFSYACSFLKWKTRNVVIFVDWVQSGSLIMALVFIALSFVAPLLSDLFYRLGLKVSYLRLLPWVNMVFCLFEISQHAANLDQCHRCDPAKCTVIPTPLFVALKSEIGSFVVTTLICSVFVFAMDFGFGRRYSGAFTGQGSSTRNIVHSPLPEEDPDVAKEKERVKKLDNDYVQKPALISDGLTKQFSGKIVAKDVTFTTDRGQLFGLLGANGAGKTTTFKMLSASIGPTEGTAMSNGEWKLEDFEYFYVRNIGYSPQLDGLLPGLTARATMRLFGRLRGLRQPTLNSHVDSWLKALDMTSLADRPCQHYSGGNKKKLSFAVAMIGNPIVVLLDEPTTGIAPIVRRRMWSILTNSLAQNHQAIVLSSHTMSECEAICDRLTIMINGQMKCLGSIPKLKKTYGNSIVLKIVLPPTATSKSKEHIHSTVTSQFTTTSTEDLWNILIFKIKMDKMKTYEVYSVIQKMKEGNPDIEDFTVTETPLEEIFMEFAQQGQGNPAGAGHQFQGRRSGSRAW